MESSDSQPEQYAGSGVQNSNREPARTSKSPNQPRQTTFSRQELTAILRLYGMGISKAIWRDYAIDYLRDKAIFSIFRRSGEFPIYRIVKDPKLHKRQGAFAVVTPSGQILKRGHDLPQTLKILERKLWHIVEAS